MKSELEKELIHISKQLIRLKLQQDRLYSRLKEVQQQIEQDTQDKIETEGIIHYRIVLSKKSKNATSGKKKLDPRLQYSTASIKREKGYDDITVPEIGDYIRITNPKVGEPNKGIVEGFCVDGKVEIRCAYNILITRQPKNLRYHVFE